MATATPSQLALFTEAAPEPCRIRNQAGLLRAYFLIRLKTRNAKRFCWAGNEYLAGELGVSVDTVTRYINRLVALGALAVEQVIGIERRIRIMLSPEALKARLFPGHKSHWRESVPEHRCSVPEPKPASQKRTKASAAASFCPPSAESSAESVAEGQYRESFQDSLQTSPSEKGQQTRRRFEPATQTPSKVAQELDHEAQSVAVSLLAESTEISLSEAQSIVRDPQVQTATKGLAQSTIQHILTCFQAAKARGSVIRPGAWLRAALRSPESYSAPVAAPTHPSEVQSTEEARTVRIPKDQPFWSAQTEQNVKWNKPSEAGLEKLPAALREKMLARRALS